MSKKDDVQQDNDQDLATQTDSEDLGSLRQELDEVKDLAAQMELQLKRAVADYQNLEKRVVEGRQELAQWATSDLVKRLLPVVHSFDQVIKGAGEDEKKSSWFRGVELAYKQLQEILRSEGLEQIEADGQFDPALHEAVDIKLVSDDEGSGKIEESGKILKVVEKGYRLNGKVLQPAKVIVGKRMQE